MPRDVQGNTTPLPGTIVSTGDTILPSQHNPMVNDVYAMMTQSLSRDGQGGMRAPLDMGTNRVTNVGSGINPNDAVTLAQVQALIASISSVPTGTIVFLTGLNVPNGWIRANGQTLQRSAYPALWNFVLNSGNLAASMAVRDVGQYGPGDGVTNFLVPNLEQAGGLFIRPIVVGRTIGTYQADEIKSHLHTGTTAGAGEHAHVYERGAPGFGDAGNGSFTGAGGAYSTSSAGFHAHNFTTNATGGTETRPVNVAYVPMIKA